jgi:ribosomal protein S18 acetylase RimI-like enzyme
MAEISFRRLELGDLPQMYTWLGRAHVSKWYARAPSSFAEVAAKYSPRTAEDNVVQAFIVRIDRADAGYIQTYPVAEFADYAAALQCGDGVAGVDLFLGDPWRLNRGVGTKVIRRFVDEVVFGRNGARACIAGPTQGDLASIRAFEKAGFARWKTVRLGDAEPECVLRMEREPEARFAPIDLARDLGTCVAFRRDSFVASFGSAEGIDAEMGADNSRYVAQLRGRIEQVPEGNSHLWIASRIVGQTEMRLVDGEDDVGYVNLFYIAPHARGRGLGRRLHDHAVEVFLSRGKKRLRLSVSVQNTNAIAFYRRLGWTQVGTRPNREPMAILEFALR